MMVLPTQSSGTVPTGSVSRTEEGVTPSFCTPCVAGKRICGLPFSPRTEDCDGGQVCRTVTPCLPFLGNRRVRCCIPGGCSLVSC